MRRNHRIAAGLLSLAAALAPATLAATPAQAATGHLTRLHWAVSYSLAGGRPMAFTGGATGPAHRPILVEQRVGAGWRVLYRGRTDSRDDFAYTIAKAAAGSYQFDFVVPAYQGWPGVSSLGSVRVGPAGAR
ncbi:hypothetical protein [Streptacidiphilus albus]|uniref:hypothetical protein n=1 Tax=Streptacidiphilus albus TaxID=105425 RepID=UPI00128C1BD5|nr:hypothetical protein [Streptacidiphilus albus]